MIGRAYSPPCEGGVVAPSKNGSVPKTARTGWSLTSYVSKCVLKHWLVSDHLSVDGCALSGLRGLRPPSAALRWLRDFLLMPQPPLLCKEGNEPTETVRQFIHTF